MEPQTEKPDEPAMRFFTPDRYLKFNSPEDDEADRADEEWEGAIREYRRHISQFQPWLPASAKLLSNLNLHDAEFLGLDQPSDLTFRTDFEAQSIPWITAMYIKKRDAIISLIYRDCGPVRTSRAPEDWPFSGLRVHWLFDEIDGHLSPLGPFFHRILRSDGVVMEIPFTGLILHQIPLEAPNGALSSRETG